MLIYPDFNPVAFHLGPLSVHWYGIMYLIGFALGWVLLIKRSHFLEFKLTPEEISDLVFYTALGVIIGGRLGYMFFYDFAGFRHHPLQVLMVWKGGMSFHGGLIGVMVMLAIYAYRFQKKFLYLTDFIVPVVPIGLAAGRIGNFINGELWGRVTEVYWGMRFPNADDSIRHPSQLYEFLLEGIVLFVILWTFSKKQRPLGAVSGLFLILYGLFRFFLEFFREPDWQMGFVAFNWMTQGQLLSLPMIILGSLLMIFAYKKRNTACSNI